MVSIGRAEREELKYDRNAELRAFDETRAGVKGLIDAGITEIPPIFINPKGHLQESYSSQIKLPIIDLDGIGNNSTRRGEIIDKVKDASEKFGFFQVINHGVPDSVLEEMIRGTHRFFEQDDELKKPWYTRDLTKKVVYNSNFDLYTKPVTDWRDTLLCIMYPNTPAPEDLPGACSEILMKYWKEIQNVGSLLLEFLAEGLGLDPNYLKEKDRAEGLAVLCHYYPECPQPELTMGTTTHSDSPFITVLLQDHIGGLQILHQNRWIDVPSNPKALVVNIGDLLQLLSNKKYKSVEHRVLANRVGPRISVASFFTTRSRPIGIHKQVKESVEENESKYGEITVKDVTDYYKKKKKEEGLDGPSALLPLKP